MPKPRNPLVAELMQIGFSRRDAFRVARIEPHPIASRMFRLGLLSLAESDRMVKNWPFHGEQAIMAFHVMSGWRLKDAELAYQTAVKTAVGDAMAGESDISDAALHAYVDSVVAGPVRAGESFPTPFPDTDGNRAIWHDSQPQPDALADAVAEIRRLRAILQDMGVDPD